MEPAQRTEARTSRVTAPRTCSPIDNRVLNYLGEVHRQAIPSVDLSDFFVGASTLSPSDVAIISHRQSRFGC
jgi:hypothetical protein